MKQFLRWGVLASALMVLAGVCYTHQAYTQQPVPSVAATKIGVVNIGMVFTKYKKAEVYKKELETDLNPLKIEAESLKKTMLGHEQWLQSAAAEKDPVQKEISIKALRDGKRQLEDLDLKARNLIGKKQQTQLIQLYKEIHASVQKYGAENGYHAIFAYGDPPDGDLFSFSQINRKMSGMDMGGLVPFYHMPQLDVSNDVLARLNYQYTQGGGLTNGGSLIQTGGGGVPK